MCKTYETFTNFCNSSTSRQHQKPAHGRFFETPKLAKSISNETCAQSRNINPPKPVHGRKSSKKTLSVSVSRETCRKKAPHGHLCEPKIIIFKGIKSCVREQLLGGTENTHCTGGTGGREAHFSSPPSNSATFSNHWSSRPAPGTLALLATMI